MTQFVRATSTIALFLLLGAIAPAYAQHDRQNEKQGKPEKEQRVRQTQQRKQTPSAQQPKHQRVQQSQQHEAREQQGQRSQQARRQQQPHRTKRQAASWQQRRGWLQQGGWQGRSTWQQGRAGRWENEHRTWAQRGGYGGHYIPQASFNLYFGSQHWFRIHSRPTIYMGYPRFSYGGSSFLLVDPWPEYWEEDWYEADDVYIDYDDGYYLHNRRQPSVRLAITVVL